MRCKFALGSVSNAKAFNLRFSSSRNYSTALGMHWVQEEIRCKRPVLIGWAMLRSSEIHWDGRRCNRLVNGYLMLFKWEEPSRISFFQDFGHSAWCRMPRLFDLYLWWMAKWDSMQKVPGGTCCTAFTHRDLVHSAAFDASSGDAKNDAGKCCGWNMLEHYTIDLTRTCIYLHMCMYVI